VEAPSGNWRRGGHHEVGEEFLRRWDAGEWVDIDLDKVPGLVDVSMAIPLVR